MFTEERDNNDRWLFVLLVIAVFGALFAIKLIASMKPTSVPAVENAAIPSSPRVELEPEITVSRPVHVPEAIAQIYECESSGQRVLSDRPCGQGASVRIIQQPNHMQAQDTSRLYERDYTRSRSQPSISRPARSNAGIAARCGQIEREIDAINASMRQGYKNAEHRRQRLRELSDERWDLECRFQKTPASQR